jgi:hypothetical protein
MIDSSSRAARPHTLFGTFSYFSSSVWASRGGAAARGNGGCLNLVVVGRFSGTCVFSFDASLAQGLGLVFLD